MSMTDRLRPSRRTLPAVLLVAGLAACGEPNVYHPPPPPTVTVAHPERRTFTDYMVFTGRTEAVASVELRARVEGFLESTHFEEGQDVEAGKLLYNIDPSEYEARQAAAQARIAEAEAAVEVTKATYERKNKALESNAVSVLDVLEAKGLWDGAKAKLEAARADLVRADLDLEWTEVVAPMAGVTSETLVDPGNLVGAGENTLLTTIVQYDPIYAYFDMSERELLDAVRNQRGKDGEARARDIEQMRATTLELSLGGEEGWPYAGNVHYIDPEIDPQTGTLLIRGIFSNPMPYQLYPGLFVRVRSPMAEREGLLITERAIGVDQTGRYVLVVDAENVVTARPVEIGPLIDGMRVIEEGLEESDLVIVNGILRARPGAKVTPEMGTADGQRPGSSETAAEQDPDDQSQG